MREVDVTLTDYALAVELGAFGVLLCRQSAGDRVLRRRFALFFVGSALAAVTGGTVHGFLPESSRLWAVSLVALGVSAMAAWGITGRMVLPPTWETRLWRAAVGEFLGYALVVLGGARAFAVAILNYLPAAIALAVAFARVYRSTHAPGAGWGLGGMLLIFVGAAIQAGRIGVHPRYFDHNALYHFVDAVAAWLIFVAARGLAAVRPHR